MYPVKKPFLFKVRYVFVDSCQTFEPHSARNLFKRRGIAIAEHKRLQEVENLFLPSSNSHGRIIANKKRIATILLLRTSAPLCRWHLWRAGVPDVESAGLSKNLLPGDVLTGLKRALL
jgi:hypothetical protein